MDREFFQRAGKFAVTGVFITLIHVIVAISLIELLEVQPAMANGLAFAAATSVSYLANTVWSFSATPNRKNLMRFLTVSAIGCVAAMICSGFAEGLGLHYLVGISIVVIIVPGLTFVLHNFWTYKPVD